MEVTWKYLEDKTTSAENAAAEDTQGLVMK